MRYPWRQALILGGAGWLAAMCVIPYELALQPQLLARVPLPLLVVGGIVNTAIEIALAVGLGLPAARAVGLRAPVSEALAKGGDVRAALRAIDAGRAVLLGVAATVVLVALDVTVFRDIGASMLSSAGGRPSRPLGFLASFEGGITEEILLRLFIMSGVVFLLTRVWRGSRPPVFWIANVIAAVLFGLGHLPATAALIPLTPIVVARAVILNGIVGIVAGWLYWRRGLESAMVAHFSADLVLHVALGG